jgi:hypothetical protein
MACTDDRINVNNGTGRIANRTSATNGKQTQAASGSQTYHVRAGSAGVLCR